MRQKEAELFGRLQAQALKEIEIDIENVLAAWRWVLSQARLKEIDLIMESLAEFYRIRGGLSEIAGLFEQGARSLGWEGYGVTESLHDGLEEFSRVLRANGKAIIIDVVWRKKNIPREVDDCWAAGSANIFTLDQSVQTFSDLAFRTIISKEYHEPDWWDAYYEDMGNAKHWQEEQKNYHAHQDYIGLGLFVIERSDS